MRCGVLVRMMSVEVLGDLTQIAAMCVGTYGLSLACLRQTNHTPWILSRMVVINHLRICSQTQAYSGRIQLCCPTAFFYFHKGGRS